MLPLSTGRATPIGPLRGHADTAPAWQRRPNVTADVHAELRALVTWVGIIIVSAVLIGLVHVWLRIQVVDRGYKLNDSRQAVQRLTQEGGELTLEVARLMDATRLGELARTRLGMVRPDVGQELVLP